MLPGTYHKDDSDGVRRDTLVDARVEMESARAQLHDVYVTLDGLADDREGIWSADEKGEIRMMQKTADALIESCEENVDDVEAEFERLL